MERPPAAGVGVPRRVRDEGFDPMAFVGRAGVGGDEAGAPGLPRSRRTLKHISLQSMTFRPAQRPRRLCAPVHRLEGGRVAHGVPAACPGAAQTRGSFVKLRPALDQLERSAERAAAGPGLLELSMRTLKMLSLRSNLSGGRTSRMASGTKGPRITRRLRRMPWPCCPHHRMDGHDVRRL